VAVVLCFVLFVFLGIWQLQRAEVKRHVLTQYKARQQAAPLRLKNLSMTAIDSSLQYAPLQAQGYFNNQQQFLWDNKFYQHQVGYEVITPLRTLPTGKILLVDRGWIARSASRADLPKIVSIKRKVLLQGLIYLPSAKTFVLNNRQDNPGDWPRLIQKVDFAQIAKQLGAPVYPFLLRLRQKQGISFASNWTPVIMGPQRHMGYAVQWFALAIAAIVIFVIVNVERNDRE